MLNKIKNFFRVRSDSLTFDHVLDAQRNQYKDQVTYLPEKFDDLLDFLGEVSH